MKSNQGKRICAFSISILISIIFLQGTAYAQQRITLFSGKGEYVDLNITAGTVAKKGNVWKAKIYGVAHGAIDRAAKKLYLVSDYAVFVLDAESLQLLGKIAFPSSPADQINMILAPEGKKIIIANFDTQELKSHTNLYSGDNLKMGKEISCNALSKNSHFLDSKKLVCIENINGKQGVVVLDVDKNSIEKKIPFTSIVKDLAPQDRIVDVDAFQGKILFLKKVMAKSGETKDSLFLYDVSTGALTPEISVDIYGDFRLYADAKRIAVDEEKIIPLGPNLVKTEKVGKVHIFDVKTAKKLSTIDTPKEGRVVGFSKNGQEIYYWSPGTLKVLDTATATTRKNIQFHSQAEVQNINYAPFNVPVL